LKDPQAFPDPIFSSVRYDSRHGVCYVLFVYSDIVPIVQPNVLLDGCKVCNIESVVRPVIHLLPASKKRFVLRKKPAGQLLSRTAHQIEREYTMLYALHKHNINPSTLPEQIVPVPEPIILCEDNAVIGTPFYVMEFLDGRIFTDTRMSEVSPQDRREWCVNS
jgi:hypothetical protein